MPIYKKINTDFFKKWSGDMAYVLGFFAADGNMIRTKRGTHFLSFHTADKDIVYAIRLALQAQHAVSERISDTGVLYRLQIGSKEMFADLLALGFVPGKTNRMRCPDVPSQFFADFVRGYFDGDGNVWMGLINKSRVNPTRVLQITFTSGSEPFLQDLKRRLNTVGLPGGAVCTSRKKNYSRLQFSTLSALQLANYMYNGSSKLHLKRKKLRIDNFIQTRK